MGIKRERVKTNKQFEWLLMMIACVSHEGFRNYKRERERDRELDDK